MNKQKELCEMCGKRAAEHYLWELRHPESKKKYRFCSLLCVAGWAQVEIGVSVKI